MNKYVMNFFWGVLLLFTGAIIDQPVKHVFTEFFSKEKLSYKVLKVDEFAEGQILEYSDEENIPPFDLRLDDPIVRTYYIAELRIKNEGAPIKKRLSFKVKIGEKNLKILDIRHKIVSPKHKIIPFSHSLPDLVWSFKLAQKGPRCVSWTSPDKARIFGYEVFFSWHKSRGYGRINRDILKTPIYDVPPFIKDKRSSYFRALAIGKNGLWSDLSSPMEIPRVLAFGNFFEDVVWVKPDELCGGISGGPPKNYRTLREALKSEPLKTTFIVGKFRGEINSLDLIGAPSKDSKVYYLDDLKFLDGESQFSFPSGMDEGAEVKVFILFKSLEEKVIYPTLLLDGNPEIEFTRRKKISVTPEWNGKNKASSRGKLSLTPVLAYPMITDGAIFLMWEVEKDQEYAGVRIFRTREAPLGEWPSTGEEVFEGVGGEEDISCTFLNPVESPPRKKYRDFYTKNDDEPPLKVIQPVPPGPSAPSGLKIRSIVRFSHKQKGGNLQYVYVDRDIKKNSNYSYKVYAFNGEGKNSYPVLVNASVGDSPYYSDCELTVQDKPLKRFFDFWIR